MGYYYAKSDGQYHISCEVSLENVVRNAGHIAPGKNTYRTENNVDAVVLRVEWPTKED